jgi:hypothetical protein
LIHCVFWSKKDDINNVVFSFFLLQTTIWRSGVNTRLLRQRSQVRIPHNANICVHEHVCLYWVWVFLCIICMYLSVLAFSYISSVFSRYVNSGLVQVPAAFAVLSIHQLPILTGLAWPVVINRLMLILR